MKKEYEGRRGGQVLRDVNLAARLLAKRKPVFKDEGHKLRVKAGQIRAIMLRQKEATK